MIKIGQLLPLLKNGWVAMDSDNTWMWFSRKPINKDARWMPVDDDTDLDILFETAFDIESAKDWTNSLMRCGDE